MKLISIYQCLCDETRLRILNLLLLRPLCVCHFQEILGLPQVQISKHLSYLKARKMVENRRHQNWMIYRLPVMKTAELDANLRCLQDCVSCEPVFKKDREKMRKISKNCGWVEEVVDSDRIYHSMR